MEASHVISLCMLLSVLGVTAWLKIIFNDRLIKKELTSAYDDTVLNPSAEGDRLSAGVKGPLFGQRDGYKSESSQGGAKVNQPSLTVITVDTSSNLSDIQQFWKSTGFCPPQPHQDDAKWFLSDDMKQNLAYTGALPFDGIRQIRIHWLLDSVKIASFQKGQPVYDFSKLDGLLESLWENDLQPGFEVMGNPSNYFTDFENATQIQLWRDLVFQIAKRYQDLYGIEYVSKWNFETWNEPKLQHFDGLNFTLKGFMNYYDATRDALKKVSAKIQFGGPGGECHDYDPNSYCWALLKHALYGRNILNGQTPPGIDFISIHKKGEEPKNTDVIFEKEEDFYKQLKAHLPGLSNTPIFNDEGDPLVGWNRDKWWRADVTYAAMVAKVIAEHQNQRLSATNKSFKLKLLSNDNGFLSYNPHFFTQRTLLARFQMNNTKPHHVQFIRKPVYSVMGLLSYLGEVQLKTTFDTPASNFTGILASFHKGNELTSSDSDQISLLLYSSADTEGYVSETNVSLSLINMKSSQELLLVVYRLDLYYTNPYRVWQMEGKPHTPSHQVFKQMRDQEEPLRVLGPERVSSLGSSLQLNLTLPLPGVVLVHLCDKATLPPDQVTDVNILTIAKGQVLIVWSDSCVHSKCIRTYEVEYAPSASQHRTAPAEKFNRINQKDIIFNIFVFATNSSAAGVYGSYRVRAVDYWNRPGQYSLTVHYPE